MTLNVVASDMPVQGNAWGITQGSLIGSISASGISMKVTASPVTFARFSGGTPVCKVTITGV
jgi:hypothetical protein